MRPHSHIAPGSCSRGGCCPRWTLVSTSPQTLLLPIASPQTTAPTSSICLASVRVRVRIPEGNTLVKGERAGGTKDKLDRKEIRWEGPQRKRIDLYQRKGFACSRTEEMKGKGIEIYVRIGL